MKKLTYALGGTLVFFMPAIALAAEEELSAGRPMYALAKAFAIGVAAFGGALGQGKIVAAALEGIARNPGASKEMFTPMILGVAFVESLVIFSLLVSFLIQA